MAGLDRERDGVILVVFLDEPDGGSQNGYNGRGASGSLQTLGGLEREGAKNHSDVQNLSTVYA